MRKKNYKIEMDSILLSKNKKQSSWPLMKVSFSGKPNLGEMREAMKEIDELSKTIKEKYISVTDFRELKVGKFLQSIILFGMEKTYKQFLSVSNPSELSFVIMPKSQKDSRFLKRSLEDINEAKGEKEYSYNYVFITDPNKVKEIAEKVL